jgi:hypothetical protein
MRQCDDGGGNQHCQRDVPGRQIEQTRVSLKFIALPLGNA